jgi:methyl coenzyme M reductase gamma subunit
MEAGFVSCFQASDQVIWLRNFISGLRIMETIQSPLKIYYDNNSTVSYSNNNRSSSKSKHIGIKFLAIKERVQNGLISIEHIETDFMIVDPLTKGLILKVFHGHVVRVDIVSAEDVQF